ncbi:MAG: DUF3006 domain-containing protein [Clostridium sp.]
MKEYFTVDRIEEKFYVLEDENSNIIDIEKCYIKTEAFEGDILYKQNEYYYLDKEKTNQRKKEINELMKGLWVD